VCCVPELRLSGAARDSVRPCGRLALVRRRIISPKSFLSALAPIAIIFCLAVAGSAFGARKAGVVCKQWSVSGTWATFQTNDYHIAFRFIQKGTAVTGVATLPAAEATRFGFTGNTGKFKGTLKGSHLIVRVHWPRKTTGQFLVGQYMGTVSKTAIKGTGRDITTPGATSVSWTGKGSAKCVR
jgi:hypothetical protein